MTRANTVSGPSNQSNVRRIVAFVIAALAIIGLTSTGAPTRATAAEERATGNWGTTYTGTNPKITNTRINYNGPNFNIPLSNEVIAGKITTFSGQLSFKTKPSGTNWVVSLCADDANTQCANVSPTGSWVGSNTWPVPPQTPPSPASPHTPCSTTSFHSTTVAREPSTRSSAPPLTR